MYSAWEEVYRDNAKWVYRQIFASVGNAADAEELTADVFMATLRPLLLPAARPRVRGYLRATARTVLAEHWRRHYGSPPVTIYSDEIAGIDDDRDPDGGVAIATEILSRLPERARQILDLRFLRGYSIREAADELGVTQGTQGSCSSGLFGSPRPSGQVRFRSMANLVAAARELTPILRKMVRK
jgi:RNA polymerase sigma-70 factor, ECF subfamily